MTKAKSDLEKDAQTMLADARKLIKEAGKLAEKGGFTLHFGEIGDYYPKKAFDRETYREQALAEAKENGKWTWDDENAYNRKSVQISWDLLSENDQKVLLEETIDELMSSNLDEAAEYGSPGWWHPSRC